MPKTSQNIEPFGHLSLPAEKKLKRNERNQFMQEEVKLSDSSRKTRKFRYKNHIETSGASRVVISSRGRLFTPFFRKRLMKEPRAATAHVESGTTFDHPSTGTNRSQSREQDFYSERY
jgi:hypothetical protein